MPTSPKIRFQWMTVFIGLLLMAGKFAAFYATGSNIILSDALESLVNIATGIFGLYSLYLAAKPRDADHPYGHGKIEFIAAGLEGGLIGLAGISIIVKSAYNLALPDPIRELDIGIAVVAAAGAVNFIIGQLAERMGRKHHSLTLVASGKHLQTDAWTTIVLLIALSLILWTGYVWIDSVAALLMGGYILYTGIRIVRESVSGIMDEADFGLLREITTHLETHRRPEWIDIHNFRVIRYGDSIHIDCHVTLPYYFDIRQGHDQIEEVERLMTEKLPHSLESFIHVDPCVASSCPLCKMPDCPVRQHAFREQVPWTLGNIMKNKKHGS